MPTRSMEVSYGNRLHATNDNSTGEAIATKNAMSLYPGTPARRSAGARGGRSPDRARFREVPSADICLYRPIMIGSVSGLADLDAPIIGEVRPPILCRWQSELSLERPYEAGLGFVSDLQGYLKNSIPRCLKPSCSELHAPHR